jgi:hypothetical protein
MNNVIRGNESIKREEEDKKEIENERKEFLEEILSNAQDKFKDYEKGYRTFSIKCPKDKHFSIDDEILDTVIDGIARQYECEFRSFALTEIIYPKSYTFTFYKEDKK